MVKVSTLKIVLFVSFCGLILLLAKGLTLEPNALPLKHVNEPLVSFTLPKLHALNENMSNADMPTEPYLIHVWATWCSACRQEHDTLIKLQNKGVSIVGLNYRDDLEYAQSYLVKKGDPFIYNLADVQGQLGLQLGIYGTPETFIIDTKGIIRYRHTGVIPKNEVDQLLKVMHELAQEKVS
jgi:cytochrome c biogenesis protein CcmG, thiol:disulfide interchange protein DsbE